MIWANLFVTSPSHHLIILFQTNRFNIVNNSIIGKLLARRYDVTEGRIEIGGTVLFNDTIRYNIRYGPFIQSDSHGAECDYWSLGILAFEMLYGNTPFTDMEGSVINTYSNIMMHSNKVTKQVDDLRKLREEKSEMSSEIRKMKTDASVAEAKTENLKKKIDSLEKENKKVQSLEVNNKALMELSKELDMQVTDFESIKDKLEVKIQKIDEEKRELVSKLDKEKEETRKAKIAVNEEKSMKLLQESKIKDFKQRLGESEKELETAKTSHEVVALKSSEPRSVLKQLANRKNPVS